jgi:hypothetical protein
VTGRDQRTQRLLDRSEHVHARHVDVLVGEDQLDVVVQQLRA